MSKYAAMLLSCGMPTFNISLNSAIKYLPKELPLYIFDDSKEGSPGREVIDEHIKPFIDRVTRIYSGDKRFDWATAIFCKEYPQYDYVLKFDDDVFFTDNDVFDGLMGAYNAFNDTAIACAFQPIQRYSLPIIAERLHHEIPEQFYEHDLRHVLGREPTLAKLIWDMTTPPESVLGTLRQRQPRYLEIRDSRRAHWTICHMLVARDDMMKFWDKSFKRGEEHFIHIIREKGNRPIALDTHNLVYHYAWRGGKEYSDKNILPDLTALDFWKI